MKHKTLMAALLFVSLAGSFVEAQTPPSLTFTLETTTPDGQQILPRLIWSATPAPTSCTASGAASWTGTKPASGNVQLPAVSASQTYGLVCNWPGVAIVALTWDAPTTNTDGTPLTDLAGFRVQWGLTAADLSNSAYIQSPTARSWNSGTLAANTWHFGVRAFNALGLEGPLSTVVSKATTAAQNVTRSLALTVKFPGAPTNVQ
jgi:hypothetical protein